MKYSSYLPANIFLPATLCAAPASPPIKLNGEGQYQASAPLRSISAARSRPFSGSRQLPAPTASQAVEIATRRVSKERCSRYRAIADATTTLKLKWLMNQ
ncbi:hypothetical protein [Aureliella helgolandensis]|uniref:Uncharacterized protein n=1 Tax=Aureliella helgolandensis TaxID=2527968 RepID=A0A518G7N8_9BACT|nr:hypothetical protein [Aureliella helgolandensis]QDV24606.1 hypothetical protein Q31a_29260 [Aureliella helgolandensis]